MAAAGMMEQMPSTFDLHQHVENAGVLFGLPALLSQGLIEAAQKVYQRFSNGYYGLQQILLLLAFMALCRIKNPEQLKKHAPGELGKILGLDRCPEVKCLRAKIEAIVSQNKAADYLHTLGQTWIGEEGCLYFYADGHVRIYTGSKARLPKKYVARQKLCLTGTQEFWINNQSGSPLTMYIGELNERLKEGIGHLLPTLIQATEGLQLPFKEPESTTPRFTLVFDREVYEPAFFKSLWQAHRVAVITYRKNVKDKWPESEFKQVEHQYDGQKVEFNICAKEIELDHYLFREIRVLSEDGTHQSAILTTNFILDPVEVAHKMFSRWNQENFFRYMISDFNFDQIIQYGYEEVESSTQVNNPQYALLDYQLKKLKEKKQRVDAQYYNKMLIASDQPIDQMGQHLRQYASLHEKGQDLQQRIAVAKENRAQVKRRIPLTEMTPDRRYNKLKTESKYLMNIIRMIAYRAETALYNNLPSFYLNARKDGRMLLKEIFTTPADIIPDEVGKTLTIKLYPLSTPRGNKAAIQLCEILNDTETLYPGTDLKLCFTCVRPEFT